MTLPGVDGPFLSSSGGNLIVFSTRFLLMSGSGGSGWGSYELMQPVSATPTMHNVLVICLKILAIYSRFLNIPVLMFLCRFYHCSQLWSFFLNQISKRYDCVEVWIAEWAFTVACGEFCIDLVDQFVVSHFNFGRLQTSKPRVV